jgi:DNA-3-methyladenine glycosylase
MPRLGRSFFARDTVTVARELLGQRLVRRLDAGQRLAGIIVEAEAYVGDSDKACHASVGRTERNAVMFGPAGHAYVYFIYGMYYCLNVVTERPGFPAAVLIRALEPVEGLEYMAELRGGRPAHELTSGPGRLCQALAIDRRLNGADLCGDAPLWIEAGETPAAIVAGPRVGVRGDALALERPWRFYVLDNPFVSGGRPALRPPRRAGISPRST